MSCDVFVGMLVGLNRVYFVDFGYSWCGVDIGLVGNVVELVIVIFDSDLLLKFGGCFCGKNVFVWELGILRCVLMFEVVFLESWCWSVNVCW